MKDLVQRLHMLRLLSVYLACAGVLSLVGIIFVYEASSVVAGEWKHDTAFYVKRQAQGLMLGIVLMLAVSLIPLNMVYAHARSLLAIALLLTLVPLAFSRYAVTVHGSTRWLALGSGYAIQPSEFIKVTLIPCIASYLTDRHGAVFRTAGNVVWYALGIALCAALVFLVQPDFGQAALVVAVAGCMGYSMCKHPGYLLACSIPCSLLAVLLIVMQPYRLRRIMTFLRPWDDPQGAGFQIIQSLIAIGSGGWYGQGIAQSQQKYFYLPMQHTDFIFAIIAEETGFIGSCLLIGLYLTLLFVGIQLALRMQHAWSALVVGGYTLLMSLQALMNLAVTTGIAPTKGIGLPFISYGVSSLLAHCCMLGMVVACVRYQLVHGTMRGVVCDIA